jgi:PAS domain S-box-containing protein
MLLAAAFDAVWECDLAEGTIVFCPTQVGRPAWLPSPSPGPLREVLSWLEPWEKFGLLRSWVRIRRGRTAVLDVEVWLSGRTEAVRIRAVAVETNPESTPSKLAGTVEPSSDSTHPDGSIHPSLRMAVESSAEALLGIDPAAAHTLLNAPVITLFALERQAGWQRNTRWSDILRGCVADPDEFLQLAEAASAPGVALQFRLNDGRYVEASEGPYIVRRRVVGRIWRFRDITAQHETHEQLRVAKERLELGLLGTTDGIFDWDLNTGTIYATRVGTCSLEETYKWVHPDDLARMQEATRAHLEDGQPYDVEYRTQPPGKPMSWARARGQALRDQYGRPYRFVGCYTDITARRQAVEALERREREYRTVLSQIQEVVFETDLDGTLRYLNPAWHDLLGYEVESCLGRPIVEFVCPADQENLQRHLRSDDLTPHECRWMERNGKTRWLELRRGRIGEPGQDPRTFGTLVDVEGRRAMRDEMERARLEAEQASSAKSEFLATVSHELRTPLNVIVGSNDLLLESPLTTEGRQYGEMVRSNARILSRLINDLLDISRIEAGQIETEAVPFDPLEVLDTVCEQFRVEAQAKGLTLDLFVLGQLSPRLVGDPHRLRQIIGNLVGNAVKFTSSGSIGVVAEPSADGLRIVVRDSGIGIAAEALGRIFEKFVQLANGTVKAKAGVGLGLPISRSLAERMGGRLFVESEPGVGSSFVLELPLRPAPHSTGAAVPVARLAFQTKDPLLRRSVEYLLAEIGVSVVVCRGPRDVEKLQSRGGCSALLLDESDVASKAFRESAAASSGVGLPVAVVTRAPRRSAPQSYKALDRPLTRSRLVEFLHDIGVETGTGDQRALNVSRMRAWRIPPLVLLVDDNADSLNVSSAIVRRCGCSVETATSGAEAIAKASASRYDLILMDVEMPDIGGLEATLRIRAEEQKQQRTRVPIVALTAHAAAGHQEACRLAGMDDHLAKPATIEAVTTKISAWISAQPLVVCAGGDQAWIRRVREVLGGVPEYRTAFAGNAGEAAGMVAMSRVSAVVADHAFASSAELRKSCEAARNTPLLAWREGASAEGLLADLEASIWAQQPAEPTPPAYSLPPEILDMIPRYLENRRRDVDAIDAAVAKADAHTIQQIAHNLKGSGSGYGFPGLSALGREIESLAKEGACDRIAPLNRELDRQLRRLQDSLAAVPKS